MVFQPWNLMPLGEKTKRARTLPEAEETTETRCAWLVPCTAIRSLPMRTVTTSAVPGERAKITSVPGDCVELEGAKISPLRRRATMLRATAPPIPGTAASTGSGAELMFTIPSLQTVT